MGSNTDYDHERGMQEIEQNKHRFTFEFECPAYSTKARRLVSECSETGELERAVVCDHLDPILGGDNNGHWPSGEPLSANMIAFARVVGLHLLQEPGDFDVAAGFCTDPALPERICICRTWGRCTDA